MIFHRCGWFDASGRARLSSWVASPSDHMLMTPPTLSVDDEPLTLVPLDDHPDIWLRLHAECAHPPEIRTMLRHEGGRAHPRLAHVLLPGDLAWEDEPHPAVAAHRDGLAPLSPKDWIRRLSGLPMKGQAVFHPDCSLDLQSATLDFRYDGSVGVQTHVHVKDPDGEPTDHRHTSVHRLSPTEWSEGTPKSAIKAAYLAHHDALGLKGPAGMPHHLA